MGFDCKQNNIEPFNLLDAQTEKRTCVSENDLFGQVNLGSNVVISGGHFPIGNQGELLAGKNARDTMQSASWYIRNLRLGGYQAQVALMINDLHVPAEVRREVHANFNLPNMLRMGLSCADLDENDLIRWRGHQKSPHYGGHYWEQPLANRFSSNSHVSFKAQFPEVATTIGGACQKALVEMVLDFYRQDVDTYIGVFPGCSVHNVSKGLIAAKEAMPEMNIYALFSTSNCWQ